MLKSIILLTAMFGASVNAFAGAKDLEGKQVVTKDLTSVYACVETADCKAVDVLGAGVGRDKNATQILVLKVEADFARVALITLGNIKFGYMDAEALEPLN